MSRQPPYVAVVGPGEATVQELAWAEEVGRRLAQAGAIVVCGGLGGVMGAAAAGARAAGGVSVGLLPGADRQVADVHLTVALPTGLGELRNGLVVRAADAVIAVGGGHGTLSEIALGLKGGKPVFALASWDIRGAEIVTDPAGAVAGALRAAAGAGPVSARKPENQTKRLAERPSRNV